MAEERSSVINLFQTGEPEICVILLKEIFLISELATTR